MKSLRNKVILSGIVLLFAFIATIGSTYAWFTVSTQTNIESMELSVSAADNLLLRARTGGAEETLSYLRDASNYSTFISNQELQEAGYLFTGTDPWRLQPSTVLSPTTAVLSYLPNIENRTYSPAVADSYNGHYIKLDFWLLSQSEADKTIQLSDFTISSIDLGNTATQEHVQNAVRLAIWLDDTTHGAAEGGTVQGAGSMFLFGRDTDYGFTFILDMPGYDATTQANNTAPDQTGFSVNTTTTTSDLYTVKFNIPTLVTVLIYIEGWDAQASNDIILATFEVGFGFKYKE